MFSVSTTEFLGENGRLTGLRIADVTMADGRFVPVEGGDRVIDADLVLLAMGFIGPERAAIEALGLDVDRKGNIARDEMFATNVDGVFVAGDAGRGQSLIVWAIAEGRSAAHGIDAYLTGEPSELPKPISPLTRPLAL